MTRTRVGSERRRGASAVVLALAAMVLVSCGEGGENPPSVDPSRTGTSLPSPTAELPSPTAELPSPTADRPSPTRSPDEPDDDPTRTPSTDEPPESDTAEAPPEDDPAEETGDEPAEEAEDDPDQRWGLLVAWVVLLGGGVFLLVRSRRGKSWEADLAAAEAEVAWMARELVPELRGSGSREAAAGGLAVSSDRVRVLEDRLTALEATARDGAGRGRARTLRDAVRAARSGLEAAVAPTSVESTAAELDVVSRDLEAALRAAEPGSARS